MSADFWAGYVSGAAGILIGNPLDLIKVRMQTGTTPIARSQFSSTGSLIRGATAPILGYGALNALLFMTYNRSSSLLTTGKFELEPGAAAGAVQANLWTTWIAGALGGVATWIVSTPTEVIKCRTQIQAPAFQPSQPSQTSWGITKQILRQEGIRGLYFGGVVTALRDSIGYGFYFWSYELTSRWMVERMRRNGNEGQGMEAMKAVLCGGFAGVVTWASVFPLDVVKTRVQTQVLRGGENAPLIGTGAAEGRRLGAIEVARNAYRNEGASVFFRGLGVCSVRAFIVNAAQWAVYEWIMRQLDPAREVSGIKDTS
jgi:solute carrier family 25 carnitine/acylcarnitine transporter 20/29